MAEPTIIEVSFLVERAAAAAEERRKEREADRERERQQRLEREAAERERVFEPIRDHLNEVLGETEWVVERVGSADGDSPWVVVHPMETPQLQLIARVGTIAIAETSGSRLPRWGTTITDLADLGEYLINARRMEQAEPATSGLTPGGSCRD